MFLWLISLLDVSELVFLVYCCVFFSEARNEDFDSHCADYTGWQSSGLILTFTGLAFILALLIVIGVTNLIILNFWLRQIKHMTTYEYIVMQRKAAAKYKDGSTVNQNEADQHLSMSQVPLVRGHLRTNPIMPLPLMSSEGKTAGDCKTTTVSPEGGNSDNLS